MDNDVVLLGDEGVTETVTAGTLVSGAVKAVKFDGIAKEITGVLPVVLPVLVTIIALRKGISFLMGTLRGA